MSPDLIVPKYMKSAFFPHTCSRLSVANAVLFSLVPTPVVCESVAARRILILRLRCHSFIVTDDILHEVLVLDREDPTGRVDWTCLITFPGNPKGLKLGMLLWS